MKVYFTASIKGRDQYLEDYKSVLAALKDMECQVTEQIIEPSKEYVYGLSDKEKVAYYKKVLEWIGKADIVVAEVSYPSINVGHEITTALEKGKPVIALYTGNNDPHLLQGLMTDKLIISNYDRNSIKTLIKSLVQEALDQMDVRFNFFVSPEIIKYLDWLSQKKRIPRAVYLRELIEKDMHKNKDFENN